jgi:hypothetical protein
VHQLRHCEGEEIRLEFIMWTAEKLEKRPLSQCLEFTIRLRDRDNLTARKKINPAGKTPSLSTRSLCKPTHDAVCATKKAHCLAGFRPVPLANAKSLIDEVGHAAIVPRGKGYV